MSRLSVLFAIFILSGCTVVGPASIETGRSSYNQAIETTARQQTLMNIIRVHNNETPLFIDVPEVDASVQFQASATGAVSNIGAKPGTTGGTLEGRVEAAGAGLNYEESPTVRYQPVQGQALNAQVSSPITVDTISALLGSQWPTAAVLAFAADDWAPQIPDTAAALNMLLWLGDQCGSLAVAATKSDFSGGNDGSPQITKAAGTSITIQTAPQSTGGNDSVDFYFTPERKGCDEDRQKAVWKALLNLYKGTQPTLDGQFLKSDNGTPRRLELRTSPIKYKKGREMSLVTDNLAPVLRTHSALGILKSVNAIPRQIMYVSEDQYRAIKGEHHGCEYFYTISPDLLPAVGQKDEIDELNEWKKASYWSRLEALFASGKVQEDCLYLTHTPPVSVDERDEERVLNHLRRYILIVNSPSAPPMDAYVSWQDRGIWYYIMGDDRVSQQNFTLIAQFMTIQSTVPPNQSLTAVSVGPH